MVFKIMNVTAESSCIWNRLQSKVVSLANTFYGMEAIKNMTRLERESSNLEEYKTFGALSVNDLSKLPSKEKINTFTLDSLVEEKMFVDFSFNRVDTLVGIQLPDASKFIDFANSLPVKRVMTVQDKLNQLLKEKGISEKTILSKKDIFINDLKENLSSKVKSPTAKLEFLCVLAEKYNSSRSLLHLIRINNFAENVPIAIVTQTANDFENNKAPKRKLKESQRRLKI